MPRLSADGSDLSMCSVLFGLAEGNMISENTDLTEIQLEIKNRYTTPLNVEQYPDSLVKMENKFSM